MGFSHNKIMIKSILDFSPLKSNSVALLAIFCLIFTLQAQAQKIKVKKIKGKTAIVESSILLEEGQTYDLQPEMIATDIDYKTPGFKSRQNSISFGGSFASLRGSDFQRNNVDIQIRYGWNFSTIEFGALGEIRSNDVGGGSTNEIFGGGFFDYNLVPNRDPKYLTYGPLGLVAFGSTQYPNNQGGGSSTNMELNAGAFLKWFLTSANTALRLEGYIDYQQINTTKTQSSLFGLGSRALFSLYF